jgi:Carboxypeptidase regulatory-like domain
VSDNGRMRVRKFFRVLAAIAFAAGAVVAASPDTTTTTTTVSVTVTNSYDKPVNNAAVILDFVGAAQIAKFGKHKQVHWEARTDQKGVAKFPPVPQGALQVQVVAKNYQTFGNKYDIDTAEKTIEVKLQRPQDQFSAHPPLKPADAPPADPKN